MLKGTTKMNAFRGVKSKKKKKRKLKGQQPIHNSF